MRRRLGCGSTRCPPISIAWRSRVALLAVVAALGCRSEPAPPRIVLIVADTLRADYATCCGRRPATPALDALAARGQRFANAVGSFHQTTMSMGALFTGRTPSLEAPDGRLVPFNGRNWCGMARFAEEGEPACLPRSLQTLPDLLRAAGYETIGVASNELLFAPAGFERGFDDWVEVWDPATRGKRGLAAQDARHRARAAERVNEAALTALARRRTDHFFLYVHYMDAHDYVAGRTAYAAGVEQLDAGVGALLDALRSEGLLEGTVVVFTADHGERIGEEHLLRGKEGHWGQPSFEEVLRVPLIVAPARFEDDGRLVRSQDLFALLGELAGVEVDEQTPLAEDELFLTEGAWRTYRRGRWKSFNRRDSDQIYLLDLEADPEELYDLAPLQREVAERHLTRGRELGAALATESQRPGALTDEDEERLRALGYLD